MNNLDCYNMISSSSSRSAFDKLQYDLVDLLMDDAQKSRFKLHVLASGGCAAPCDIVPFPDTAEGYSNEIERIVDSWLKDDLRGHIIHQAFLSSRFDSEHKNKIAYAAWSNRNC